MGYYFQKKTTKKIIPRLTSLAKIKGIDYYLNFISILYELALSDNQKLLSTFTSENENFENSDQLEKVHEFVHSNYHRKISLSEISELINMSQVTFNRFIKKRTGRTFITYLNDIRIGFAAQFLIDSSLNVSEIGYKCGFNNKANYNRIFKKGKNCTPSEFRRQFEKITQYG